MGSSIHKSDPRKRESQAKGAPRKGTGARGIKDDYVCDVQCIHPELLELLEGKALDWSLASEISRIFQVMSDPTRLRIISLLAQAELCVCDIAAALNMTQSAVSHQLRVLRISELVKVRKEGRIAWYSLDDGHVLKLFTQGLDHVEHQER